jgi:hypothetical protein
MTQERKLPAIRIVVELIGPEKVFSLYRLHFKSLPAEVVTGNCPVDIQIRVLRRDGTGLIGRVSRPNDYPNGTSGGPPHFLLRGPEANDITHRILQASFFDEGDILAIDDLPLYFNVELLERLGPYFEGYKEFYRRYFKVLREYDKAMRGIKAGSDTSGEAANIAMWKFIDDTCSLLVELKDLPRWPALISLK